MSISFCTYLNTYNNHQGCCYGDSKRLLVGKMRAVLSNHDREGPVRNKEEQERCGHPLQRAQEELSFVEEKVLLAWFVQSWVTKAVLVVHILQETKKS